MNKLNIKFKRIEVLLNAIGIDTGSFLDFIDWALTEQLVEILAKKEILDEKEFFGKKDSLKKFKDLIIEKTGRKWSVHDLNLLFTSVKNKLNKHFREPLTYGEYLKLLWTIPHMCVKCKKEPPEIKLHIDHIIPVSLGGPTKSYNLQFLCKDCNLHKSNKLEGGKPWLDLL